MPRDSEGPLSALRRSSRPSPALGSGTWGTTRPNSGSPKDGHGQLRDRVTRFGDLVIACVLLVFTLPLIVFIVVIIRCEASGPILVWQQRMGLDGRVINALRFRTSPAFPAGIEWFRRNQRTRVGEVLWRTHLDGIPMVINVLRGDMTILGSGKRARLLR